MGSIALKKSPLAWFYNKVILAHNSLVHPSQWQNSEVKAEMGKPAKAKVLISPFFTENVP